MKRSRSRSKLLLAMSFWVPILLALFGLAGCGAPDQPNVVLIIIDTLRADKLGAYGHPEAVSPELDAIARDGVLFERVLAQSSWTRPSVGSLLTSRYPRSLGLYDERDQAFADRFQTLAEVLKANGYKTFGLTANPNINSVFNFDQGFDRYLDSTVRWRWMEAEPDKPTNKQQALQSANELFATAFDWVGSGRGGPFYLQLDLMEVHEHMRTGVRNMVRDEYKAAFEGVPDRAYLQTVRQVSADVGAFVERWLAKPQLRNTLFILLSDHGEGLEDHPGVQYSRGHGSVLYESNLRVPWMLYHPGYLEPRTVTRDVRLLDMVPTVLDYLQLPIPRGAQGVSLLPLMDDEEAEVGLPEFLVAETEYRRREKVAVYSPEWIFIENRRRHQGVDALELQPVGVVENGRKTDRLRGHPTIAAELRKYLADWERRFPKEPATPLVDAAPSEVLEQLRSLGYVE